VGELAVFQKTNDAKALSSRANSIRRDIISMLAEAKSGHPGGSLSAADIGACLFFSKMNHDPANPKWPGRDRFVLCKGHAAPLLYALLAECGYFPKKELSTLRKTGSMLQGHPDSKKTPGVDASTGSLGQGLSIASGMAIGLRLDHSSSRIYALLGDGECQEGQVWEAAMAAAHYKLDNLCAIIDVNGLQIDGATSQVMTVEPVCEKFASFGWHVIEIDGHDCNSILAALDKAGQTKGKPTAIVARTVKGKGVSFMEHKVEFHGKAPSQEQAAQAIQELVALGIEPQQS